MPLAILHAGRFVAQVVLPAQFIRDSGGCGIQIARAPHDLGAAAAVVSDFTQRERVDTIVHASAAARIRRGIVWRWRRWIPAASARHRERKRDREPRSPWPLEVVPAETTWEEPPEVVLAVDADRIHEHFRFADDSLQRLNVRAAAGVVAVGNDHERSLAVVTRLREGHGVRDSVVQGRAAARLNARELVAQLTLVVRPTLDEHRVVVEPVQKDLIVRIVELIEEAVERFAGGDHLFAFHAPARVEDDPETDRYALVVEVRDRLKLLVLIHAKIVLAKTRDEPAVLVGDRRGHVNQFDTGLETKRRLIAGRR